MASSLAYAAGLCTPCRVGLVAVDLATGCPRHDQSTSPSTWSSKLWSLSGDGNDLAGVDHADVYALGGHHDGATLGHAPLAIQAGWQLLLAVLATWQARLDLRAASP